MKLRFRPLLTGLLVVLGPAAALACTCVTRNLQDELQDADLVAHGQVIHEERKADHYLFTVVVKRRYKSAIQSDTLLVRTHTNPALNCDAVLELNKEYIFYVWAVDAAAKRPVFRTRTCSRTAPYNAAEAKELLKATGQ